MEDVNQSISNRLKGFKFRRIRLPNPNGDSADTTTLAETPFTTVPHFHTRHPWQSSTTAAFEFLRHLPLIAASTLPEDKLACHICYEPYISPKPTEMPTILPCQHILGRKCIGQWILPPQARPKNTCPMCRGELFNEDAFKGALASPIEESGFADWVNETKRSYQGAPHAGARMEFLIQELERIGRETVLRTPTAIAADIASLQGMVNRYGDMVRVQERRIDELLGREGLAQPLRQADRAEVERLRGDLVMLQEMTRTVRAVFPLVTGTITGLGTDGGGE